MEKRKYKTYHERWFQDGKFIAVKEWFELHQDFIIISIINEPNGIRVYFYIEGHW
jgi:hypothetical protein